MLSLGQGSAAGFAEHCTPCTECKHRVLRWGRAAGSTAGHGRDKNPKPGAWLQTPTRPQNHMHAPSAPSPVPLQPPQATAVSPTATTARWDRNGFLRLGKGTVKPHSAIPTVLSPRCCPHSAHHLAQLRLQVCLLHTQLLIGLDHLVQLLLALLALLQLQDRAGGSTAIQGTPKAPSTPLPPHAPRAGTG